MNPIDEVLQHINLPFTGTLHEYQKEDITEACRADNFGFFLDLGLGKSVCAAITGTYKLMYGYTSCLVLCPESLVSQWAEMLSAMGLATLDYRGTPLKRSKMDLDVDFAVMSYQVFNRDRVRFENIKAYYIIDEATVMCNSQNLLYKQLMGGTVEKKKKVKGKIKPDLVKTVYKKINHGCCLLTATPINRPENSYGLIKILTPDVYRNYSQFKRLHIAKEDYFGAPEEYKDLEILKENLLLNASLRSAADHLDLPPIVFKTVKYDLAPAHKKLYDTLIEERMLEVEGKEDIDAVEAVRLYNWAQKIILNPDEGGYEKVPVGIDILDGLVDSVDKYLLFGNYRMTNTKLMERYKIGASYGDISSTKKRKYIKDFVEGDLKGLVAHARSGGYGLNLQNCSHIFYPELPITPRDFLQTVGRCYRQGQQNTVVVTVLVARNTIQEALFEKIMEKDDLMKQCIDTPRSLTEDLLSDVVKADTKSVKELMKELRGES